MKKSHLATRPKFWLFLLIFMALATASFFTLTSTSVQNRLKELSLASQMYDAVSNGKVLQVKTLIKNGANPNRHGAGGLVGGTPFVWATGRSDLAMMRLLLKSGANVNEQIDDGNGLYTPLVIATTPQAVRLLIHAGANPHLCHLEGLSASQWARKEHRSPEVIKLLQRAEKSTPVTSSRRGGQVGR